MQVDEDVVAGDDAAMLVGDMHASGLAGSGAPVSGGGASMMDVIPDANAIAQAKLRRERLRKQGDFISLNESASTRDSANSGRAPLGRQDDDDQPIADEGHFGAYSGTVLRGR